MDPYSIIVRPVISEASVDRLADGKYTFIVHPKATKPEIKRAVETLFDVDVTKVNTMNYRGKRVRVRVDWGRRPSWKKAIVTVAEGQQIKQFFEELMS